MMKTLTIATAAIVAFTAAPAIAGPVAVRHADLDLAKPADRAVLDRRIARAVEAVCGSYFQATPEEERDITACRAGAIADLGQVKDALIARAGTAGTTAVASR
jgi:UrcA family protein